MEISARVVVAVSLRRATGRKAPSPHDVSVGRAPQPTDVSFSPYCLVSSGPSKVRVFIVAARLPFPIGGGPDFRTWMIADALSRSHPVGVFGVAHRLPEAAPTGRIEVWESASHEAALTHNRVGLGDGSWVKDPDWRPSAWYYHPLIEDELASLLADFEPDVVILEQLGIAAYLPAARNAASVVVLNQHNVESDLQRQLIDAEASAVQRLVRRQFAERTKLLEAETLTEVDQVWVCGEADRVLLLASFGAESRVVPNAVPAELYEPLYRRRTMAPAGAPTLIFPAQFTYLPNEVGALFMLDEIMPLVLRDLPRASLMLAGRDPGPRLVDAARENPAVVVTGAVPSMLPYLESADVMVIPLREGGGTRLKALEGFAAGLPVVSTAKGMEGLEVQAGTHYLHAETAREFADAIKLAVQPAVAAEMREAAYELVTERYGSDAVAQAIATALSTAPMGG